MRGASVREQPPPAPAAGANAGARERYNAERAALSDEVARRGDRWKRAGGAYHRRLERIYRLLIAPGQRVLEIGCGTGEFTGRIGPHVKELWATDLSPELLARAETALASNSATVRFDIQDAMQLRLENDSFDSVFGCSVLHHLKAESAFREVFRVLKPGKWCVFSEPNMLNPQIALQKKIAFLKRRVGDSPDETAFFRHEVQRLLRQADFTNISVQHFDFLHPLTPASWIASVERLGLMLEKIPGIRAISGSLIFCAQKRNG